MAEKFLPNELATLAIESLEYIDGGRERTLPRRLKKILSTNITKPRSKGIESNHSSSETKPAKSL
uniref:Uncharacterized protein n=1 Tax=Pristionchus pacificus TaxID=54126 RepID=A0A2A6CCL1_PRIPA|eukprot:PDM75856.1 hypothetical protein PRIPAC_40235 [Pristionchus pacificus]